MMRKQRDTYKPLVCEFLSTLVVDIKKKLLTFQMGNIPRVLLVEEINDILKVPQGGFFSQMSGISQNVMWKDLTHPDEEYISNAAKALEIRNPIF